jgi:hypothetical protein
VVTVLRSSLHEGCWRGTGRSSATPLRNRRTWGWLRLAWQKYATRMVVLLTAAELVADLARAALLMLAVPVASGPA